MTRGISRAEFLVVMEAVAAAAYIRQELTRRALGMAAVPRWTVLYLHCVHTRDHTLNITRKP